MPSLLSLPVASSPGATDKLWLTQGTGTDRDKQVTTGDLIAGSMASVVAGFSAPSALTGAETVPLLQTTMKEMPISSVFIRYPLTDSLVVLKNYNNGTDATLAAMDAGGSGVIFGMSPGGSLLSMTISLNLSGRSASASNSNNAVLDFAGAIASLPAAVATALGDGSLLADGVVLIDHNSARSLAWSSAGAGVMNFLAVPTGVRWQDLAGTNNQPLGLSGTVLFRPNPI